MTISTQLVEHTSELSLLQSLLQAHTQKLKWVGGGSFLEKVDLCIDLCRLLALSP